ncbi:MAG: hypothetical protein CMD58_01905 [Gammaproteobacteria bacterium]|nr:hypothetical protein [Gammaproteobacteria bacterium]
MANKNKKTNWMHAEAGSSSVTEHKEPDSFKTNRQDSVNKYVINLVREAIQNTIDATEDFNERYKEKNVPNIKFNHYSSEDNATRDYSEYFLGLEEKINTSEQANKSYKKLDKSEYKNPGFILIRDSGTGGIQGDKDSFNRANPFWDFILNWGISNKNKNRPQLGQKGLGRQAFLFTSKIKTVFVMSKRISDRVLSGIAYVNPEQFTNNNKRFDSQCVYAKDIKAPIFELHEDPLDGFEHNFNINYEEDETGTAIVIPLPREKVVKNFDDSAKASIIQNFIAAILQDNLKSFVNDNEINRNNALEITKEDSIKSKFISTQYKNNCEDYFDFLENIISDDDPNEINLDEDNLTFDENEISDDDKQEYIQELTDKKYLKFRFNFEVKLQDGSMEKTYLDVGIGIPEKETGGIAQFYRNGMLLYGEKPSIKKIHHGVLLCDDPVLSDLWNHSEDTGHTKLHEDSGEMRNSKYDVDHANEIIMFCHNVLEQIQSLFMIQDDGEDLTAFDDLFLIDEELDIEDEPEENDDDDLDDDNDDDGEEWVSNDKNFSVRLLKNGILRIQSVEDKKPPKEINVVIKYQYDPTMQRGDSGIYSIPTIAATSCTVKENTRKKKIDFSIINIENGFRVDVFDIDKNSGIEVNAKGIK